MTHDELSNLLAAGSSQSLAGQAFPLWRWVAGSLGFHALLALLAVNIHLASSVDHSLAAFDISLISLSELGHPGRSNPPPSVMKNQTVKVSKAKPVHEPVLPPLPVATHREKLSESFSRAMQSIGVVQPMAVNQTPPPATQPALSIESPAISSSHRGVNTIQFPVTLPNLAKMQPLPKRKQLNIPALPTKASKVLKEPAMQSTSPPARPESILKARKTPDILAATEKVLRGIHTPHKAPKLASVHPFKKIRPEAKGLNPSSKKLASFFNKKIQSIQIPPTASTPPRKSSRYSKVPAKTSRSQARPHSPKAPRLSPPVPQLHKHHTITPKHSRVTNTLQELTKSLSIPKIRQVPKHPPQPTTSKTLRNKDAQTIPSEQLVASLKQVIAAVNVPKLQPSPKALAVPPTPRKSHPKFSRKDNKALDAIKGIQFPKPIPLPKLKPFRSPPPQPGQPSQSLQTELDQQLAKLSIPSVPTMESLQTRLMIQEVKKSDKPGTVSPSPGSTSAGGESRKIRYFALVQAMIDREWVAPEVSVTQDRLQAVFKFHIDRLGNVTHLTMEQGSGNKFYDAAAERAVRAAEPLPPLPKEIQDTSLDVLYQFIYPRRGQG